MTLAMPTTQDVKDYLRIQTTAEDAVIADLLLDAVGEIESLVGKSLTTEVVTWYDDAISLRAWDSPQRLILQYVPIQESTLVIKDRDSVVVDASNYQIRQDIGMVVGVGSPASPNCAYTFGNGPYTLTCTAGFGTDPNYQERWLPRIRRLVIDLAAYYYQQRTPGATSEKAAGSTVTYELDPELQLPKPIARGIRKLRGPVYAV